MTPAARLQAAIEILDGLQTSAMPADRFIREFFRARRYAGSKDRAAVSERVFDVLRHRAEFAGRMATEQSRGLVIASLITDDLDLDAVAALFTGDGYGPAALSDAERHVIAHAPAGEPSLATLCEAPEFLVPELIRRFGADPVGEMHYFTERAPVDLRVNTLKAERAEVLREFWESGYDAQATPFAPYGIRFQAGRSTGTLQQGRLFLSGAFEFQDEAAQIAALLCGAKPGMRVLDLAAGAGGKSLALAAAMANTGEIVATDVRGGALDQLRERATRAGASIIKDKLARALGPDERFDVVLVDAPCSGTGTWRRQPELRWRITPERLDELNRIQDELLVQAASHVKPGGRLVYATCSILPRENEDRVAAFLATHSGFRTVRADEVWRESGQAKTPSGMEAFFRGTPASTGTDGFFTATIQNGAE
jgi:16S rRNA (cytosine967-C5)-methyltransferase